MSNTPPKTKRKLTNLHLSTPARSRLKRLSHRFGWTQKRTVETALKELETNQVAAIGSGRGI